MTLSADDQYRLNHIKTRITSIRAYLPDDGTFTDKDRDAILYCLVVIGEAVNNLSDEVKNAAPEIPWRQIVQLRNLLAHRYWKISFEVIEEIIEKDLDPLEATVTALLDR